MITREKLKEMLDSGLTQREIAKKLDCSEANISLKCKKFELRKDAIKSHLGKTYGQLTVLQQVDKDKHGHYIFECECECGNKVNVVGHSLTSGNTKSCGCLYDISRPANAKLGCIATKQQALQNNNLVDHSNWQTLYKEWDISKNGKPDLYAASSNKSVWWVCLTCQTKWKASIASRLTNLTKCPKCAKKDMAKTQQEQAALRNNLAIQRPDLVTEWGQQNNQPPQKYSLRSNQKVWWQCGRCGHEWKAMILTRTKDETGCPRCNISHLEKFTIATLEKLNIEYQHQHKIVVDDKRYMIDFYLPQYDLYIECHGKQHYEPMAVGVFGVKSEQEAKRRLREQKRRDKTVQKHLGPKLVEIPYWNIDKIEGIIRKGCGA